MKKIIVFLLMITLLMSSFLQVFASELNDKGLEKAITKVKSIIEIPKEFSKFEYNIDSNDTQKNWRLVWQRPESDQNYGEITVNIDENGFISNYNKYTSDEKNNSNGKIPKYSRQYAKEIASNFITKLNPELPGELYTYNNDIDNYGTTTYNFNFYINKNKILYSGYNSWVSVDGNTGEVRNYHANKVENTSFPNKEGVLEKDKIEKAFKEYKGLELRYLQTYSSDNQSIYTAYVLTNKGKSQIDAFTGNILDNKKEINIFEQSEYMNVARDTNNNINKTSESDGNLSTQEYNAIKEISNILTKESAEKIARSLPDIGLDDSFKLKYFYLNKSYKNKDQYIWSFNFQKENDQELQQDYEKDSCYVSINAITGKIERFDSHILNKSKGKTQIEYKDAKLSAEVLVKKLESEKFNQTEFYEESIGSNKFIDESDRDLINEFNFTYRRIVNGVPCDDDKISLGVDKITGKVNRYSIDWYDGEFPAVEKIIPIEDAYKVLFENVGMKLYYVDYQSTKNENQDKRGEIRLIYAVNRSNPSIIDSKSGKLLNYEGLPYLENKKTEYADIAGHYAEQQVKVLQDVGISLEGEKFLPEMYITQSEFLELIFKCTDPFYLQRIEVDKKEKYIYDNLIKRSIINPDEKAPNSYISKEDAVKFIIRSANYEKIAQIKDLFICNFKDKEQISQNLIGYVSLAKGLGYIGDQDNEYFKPKAYITRAEAAVLIYNSIK